MKYIMRFNVVGRGYFPVDMLRYDRCWPSGSDDACSMIVEKASLTDEPRTIELCTFCRTMAAEPTAARWASFGWQVQGRPTFIKL